MFALPQLSRRPRLTLTRRWSPPLMPWYLPRLDPHEKQDRCYAHKIEGSKRWYFCSEDFVDILDISRTPEPTQLSRFAWID